MTTSCVILLFFNCTQIHWILLFVGWFLTQPLLTTHTTVLSATLALRPVTRWDSFICPDRMSKAHCDFLTLFCNTDPNYTPQTNRERLRLKPNASALSVWHLVFVPMHLNYILTIPACIRGQRERECVQESVTCLTSLHQTNSRLKQKRNPLNPSELPVHWSCEES